MATNIDNKPSLPLTGEPQEPGQSVPQESDQSLLPTTEPKKPLPLTRKNLALLNTLNGDSKRKKHSSYFESDTMTISTTASGFAEKAYENGILDPPDSTEPTDLDTLRHRLTQRRNNIQPLPAHQRYCEFIFSSANKAKVSALVQKRIMIDYEDVSPQYRRAINQTITQTPRQDFNDNLLDPRPGLLELLFTSVLPYRLHYHALHKVDSLALCHFAAEFKRRWDKNMHPVVYQAAYDGAVLVFARNRALAQARAGAPDGATLAAVDRAAGETAVLTCATDGKEFNVFAHHYQDGAYYQNLVVSGHLRIYRDRGRELIRNAQEYAWCKSYELARLLGADL
jgi:hypothetical protein